MTTTAPAPRQNLPGVLTRIARGLWMLILPIGLLVAYQLWSLGAQNPYFPTLGQMADSFRDTWIGPGFATHVLPSLGNLARGYLLGLSVGVLAGVALGRLPALRRAAAPVVSFILTIPPVALLPLFLIVLGVGPQLQVGVIAVSVFFYVLVTTADAVRGIEPVLLDVAAIYRLRGWTRLTRVFIPAALPQILSAARVTLSLAVLVMVVSEMVGASRGIGAVTLLAQQSFAYRQMWAGMILLAILGIGLNALFSLLERLVLTRAGYITPANTKVPA